MLVQLVKIHGQDRTHEGLLMQVGNLHIRQLHPFFAPRGSREWVEFTTLTIKSINDRVILTLAWGYTLTFVRLDAPPTVRRKKKRKPGIMEQEVLDANPDCPDG